MGRHMRDFDFAASYPSRHVASTYDTPAYGLVVLGQYAAVMIAFSAIPGIIAGTGLLQFKPWARKLGIAVSIVDILFLFPVHVIVGIYGLVMLTKSEALFRD